MFFAPRKSMAIHASPQPIRPPLWASRTFESMNPETLTAASEVPVTLSENALRELKRLMNEPGFEPGQCLRIGVKGGGCSGLSYMLGFDKPEADDAVYQIGEVRLLMKPAHGLYLKGMEVDFEDGLNARGFSFKNPNASTSCGCGSSFAV